MSTSNGQGTALDPPDYWQLRALSTEVEQVQALVALAQARLDGVRARRQALWLTLAAKYALVSEGRYALVDEQCRVVEAADMPGLGPPGT